MSDSPNPDDVVRWDQLPHNPVGFFGLAEGFDQKDLKRAYNKLIRKFKPENSPAEFQQIRAAYERLDNQLRYGGGSPVFAIPPAADWNSIFANIRSEEHNPVNGKDSNQREQSQPSAQKQHQDYLSALIDEIRQSSPGDVLQRLLQKAGKSSFEYYAMAVLSDTQPDRSTETFVKHILAGLKAHFRDQGLRGILYTLFRQQMQASEIPSILIFTAKAIMNDDFYALTEPLWDVLVRANDFEHVRKLLKTCESMLRDFRIEGKLAFYLHLLRISLFEADLDWIQETFEFLEENHASLSSMAEIELDRLLCAWEYLQQKSSSPPIGELQEQMDKAIENYFSGPEETRDHGVLECQTRIATSIDEVIKAFPFNADDEKLSPFLHLWFSVSSDLAWRPRRLQRDSDLSDRRIVWFLATLQSQTDRNRYGQIWDIVSMLIHSYSAAGILGVGVITASVFFFRLFLEQGAAFFGSLAIGGVAAVVGHVFLIKPFWGRFCRKMAIKCYNGFWRREVLQFLGQSQLSSEEFFNRARELRDKRMEYVTWTLNLVRVDDALPLYSTAQMFLR